MKTRSLLLASFLLVVACGGSTPPATDSPQTSTASPPSASDTSAAAPTPEPSSAAGTPATPSAAPAAAAPASTASAAAGDCPAPKDVTAKTLAACKAECQKLDDKAPAGSRCIPPRAACMNTCSTKFPK